MAPEDNSLNKMRGGQTAAGRSWPGILITALAAVVFVLLNTYRFPGAGRDDVFVTLWSGETLGSGPWFVNFNFKPEEMMTSVLGALLAAALHFFAPAATYLLNKLCTLAAGVGVLIALWSGRRLLFDSEPATGPALFAVLATALSPVVGYWALSGLESTFYALLLLLLAIALLAYWRRPSRRALAALVLVQILLVLVRAEGFWVIPATAALLILAPERRRLNLWLATLLPAAAFAALLGLRFATTGLIWPNPVYAKVGSFGVTIPAGFAYLRGYYTASAVSVLELAALGAALVTLYRAAVGFWRHPQGSGQPAFATVALSTFIVAYDAFVVLTGGNWMEYYRFAVPAVPLNNALLARLAWPLMVGIRARIPAPRQRWAVAAAAVAALLLAVDQQRMSGVNPLTSAKNCSSTLPVNSVRGALDDLNNGAMWLNCAQRRDRFALNPFIKKRMRDFIPKSGPLTVITYQGGYFPYKVRQYFGMDQVYLIGTQGLMNSEIAVLPVVKDTRGVFEGRSIDRILAGHAGPLSEAIHPAGPTLVYKMAVKPQERMNFYALGFRPVWEKPGAIVLYRDALAGTS